MDSYKEKENCRKLSEAEKKRKAEFEALSSKLETQGYKKKRSDGWNHVCKYYDFCNCCTIYWTLHLLVSYEKSEHWIFT